MAFIRLHNYNNCEIIVNTDNINYVEKAQHDDICESIIFFNTPNFPSNSCYHPCVELKVRETTDEIISIIARVVQKK